MGSGYLQNYSSLASVLLGNCGSHNFVAGSDLDNKREVIIIRLGEGEDTDQEPNLQEVEAEPNLVNLGEYY